MDILHEGLVVLLGQFQHKELAPLGLEPSHFSLERFGKTHLVMARCEGVNQSNLDGLFNLATQILTQYRTLTNAKEIVPAEFGKLSLGLGPGYRAPRVKPMGKRH